ncbi:MAG: glycosyltransferase [Candidatus Glassbacteria bacterium]
MSLSILHVAVENICGIPLHLVKAHRRHGHRSHLVTYIPSTRGYEDDLCLGYPMVGTPLLEKLKKTFKAGAWVREVEYGTLDEAPPPITYSTSFLGKKFVQFRDSIWRRKLRKAIDEWGLLDYDIYHLEGGLGFLWSGEIVRELKARGKKIVTMYYGSDLRLRGIHPVVEAASDLNLTIEYDHLSLYPNVKFLFLPMDLSRFAATETARDERPLRIGHSPTRRELKGTESVIRAVDRVSKEHEVELVLIEGLPHEEAVRLKSRCHIFIDQVGNAGGTGYGVSSVESLAMAIPTITDFAPDLEEFLPDHPFILANPDNLPEKISALVEDPDLRRAKGEEGRQWVMRNHHADRVAERIYGFYSEMGWSGDKR